MKQGPEPAVPSPPETAREMLGLDNSRFTLVERYCTILATTGVERGLIGPREAPRLWGRHLFNCAAVAQVIPSAASVCDVGSGAGLPGLVLALARPDLQVTLMEPLLRRTTFLTEAVAELGLASQVRVERGRAEEWAGRDRFDVVTSRAVAPLDRLLEWSMPLVAPTGVMVAMKGDSAAAEVAAAGATLARLGCAPPDVLELRLNADPTGLSTATVVRVAHADPSRVSWRPKSGRREHQGSARTGMTQKRRRDA